MPFKPGQSGNPSGRKPEDAMAKECRRLAKELTPEAIERLAFWMRSDNPKASVSASNSIIDRAVGKALQTADVNHSGNIGYTPVHTERRDVDTLGSPIGAAAKGNPTQPH